MVDFIIIGQIYFYKHQNKFKNFIKVPNEEKNLWDNVEKLHLIDLLSIESSCYKIILLKSQKYVLSFYLI